jgi:hypothetical protein
MQTNDPGITGLFDTPATGEVERYLTREEQAAFLREQYGFPVTKTCSTRRPCVAPVPLRSNGENGGCPRRATA